MDREYDKMLDLLIRSMDMELAEADALALEQALSDSEALRDEKVRLIAMRERLAEWTAPEDPNFAERVLTNLGKQVEEDLSAVIIRLFPRVAAACVLILGVALGTIYVTEGSLMMDTIIGVNEVLLEDAVLLVEDGF
ncbi:MAG: hypothetical protein HRU41_27915 [Saprospiraceae bacterium]|nr:hypothetical protein [Saprospiraceae bacterium]